MGRLSYNVRVSNAGRVLNFVTGRGGREEIILIDLIFSSIGRLIKNSLVICIVKIKLLLLLKYTSRIND